MVTGRHPFDIPNFYAIFRNIPEIDFYPQSLENFAFRGGGGRTLAGWREDEWLWKGANETRKQYDVVLFYNYHQSTPSNGQSLFYKGTLPTLRELGETEQGIFILHHTLLAFPKWNLWSEIVGIKDRSFSVVCNAKIGTEITNKEHPITQGLRSWEMLDEIYNMKDAGERSDILLTTNHQKSMKTIAWTGQYKKARVFCYQSGHAKQAYANQNFRKIITRGIKWLARRI